MGSELIDVVFVDHGKCIVHVPEPHRSVGLGAVRRAISSNPSTYRFAIMGDTGDPMAAPCFCLYIIPLYVK